jgi:hypothetical protein
MVYGLQDPRRYYTGILGKGIHNITVNRYTTEALNIIADHENNLQSMRTEPQIGQGLNLTRPILKQGRDIISNTYLKKTIVSPAKSSRDFIEIFKTNRGEKNNGNYDNIWRSTNLDQFNKSDQKKVHHPWAIWKASSKIGLDIVINSKSDAKIHFVLDGLDIGKVINKEGLDGHSVTASELRFLYRNITKNKDKLGDKVIFYKQGEVANAPYVGNEQQWEDYKPRQ